MTATIVRYGKPFGPMLEIKADFFARNEELLAEQLRVTELYRAQPRRTTCKLCEGRLGEAAFFVHEVGYGWCGGCGHLNGLHDDTEVFAEFVYGRRDGSDYAAAYAVPDRAAYDRRVADIYIPKAEFLRDSLRAAGEDTNQLSFADLGAGSGYFVAALSRLGLGNVIGWEPSPTQCALAETMLGSERIRRHQLDDTREIAEALHADVVSMIGVLEHLRRPREVLAALSGNKRPHWIYLSLPLAGPAVAIEAMFPTVMRRHLVGGHTHLFTESSIDWLCAEYGFKRFAEWWFGSDLLDLYRSGFVRLQQSQHTIGLCELWRLHMLPALDAMQLALDERRLSTEAHLLLKRS